MMRLYFLRHGIAQDTAESDHARALTPDGIRRLKIAAHVMAKLNLGVTHLLTSPRVRAVQTAEIAAEALGLTPTIHEDVNFHFSIKALPGLVRPLPDHSNVMFVGHEPTFSTTIRDLTGARIVMKKGGLARVDVGQVKPMGGVLVWLITPKVFEAFS